MLMNTIKILMHSFHVVLSCCPLSKKQIYTFPASKRVRKLAQRDMTPLWWRQDQNTIALAPRPGLSSWETSFEIFILYVLSFKSATSKILTSSIMDPIPKSLQGLLTCGKWRCIRSLSKPYCGPQCVRAHAKLLQSCLTLPASVVYSPPGSPSVGFSRQEYWSGLPCPPPGDLPDPGTKPVLLYLLHWQGGSLPLVPPIRQPKEYLITTFHLILILIHWASLVAQTVKNLPAKRETWVRSLGWKDSLEKGMEKAMATHSSILACRIPWTEEPGGLQSIGLQTVRHDWATKHTDSLMGGKPTRWATEPAKSSLGYHLHRVSLSIFKVPWNPLKCPSTPGGWQT